DRPEAARCCRADSHRRPWWPDQAPARSRRNRAGTDWTATVLGTFKALLALARRSKSDFEGPFRRPGRPAASHRPAHASVYGEAGLRVQEWPGKRLVGRARRAPSAIPDRPPRP